MSEPVIVTRSLTAVLRRAIDQASEQTRLLVGEVLANVPGEPRIVVGIEGAEVTVPKLDGYNAQIGDVVYVLASRSVLLAIGTVK